jgi:hypothetical protein
MSELEKGKEVGWVLRLNKGTEENRVGEAGKETRPLRKVLLNKFFNLQLLISVSGSCGSQLDHCWCI